ncbi:lipoprotein LpqH [Mycobacterium sp. NPDC051804]|uniref:lipoprotein LpqH n=1 Tax=Mycobacterium sp. NPDC051804 TaxID=3364295 RepID=UPI0037B98A7F
MNSRLLAVLTAAALTSGCGLTGSEPAEPPQSSGKITIGDKSQQTQRVSCTQDQWALTIDAKTDTGRARAYLQLGGPDLLVRTVNLENIAGLNAISGGDVADAVAATEGGIYKITGTAVVSEAGKPGATENKTFSIEAPC